ncbi:MAG: ribose 5-phosphate isomerase B, partial [bacterium]
MDFVVGSDHAGFSFRESIVDFLRDNGHDVEDVGTHSEESCDYPKYAHRVAQEVARNSSKWGILVCGSGEGMTMTANRYPGVRAALCLDESMAEGTREHNDANVLVLAERIMEDESKALDTVQAFIDAGFHGGRHERRINKIDRPEFRLSTHPMVESELSILRSDDTEVAEFRRSLSRLTKYLFMEASNSFETENGTVTTEMGEASARRFNRDLTLVPIIRAGLGMVDPVLELLPDSKIGYVGYSRDEDTLEADQYYEKLPRDLDDPVTLLLDPMLATGGTACSALDCLKR